MFRNRRFACLFLGMWLGATVSVDVIVARNLSTADAFISTPDSQTLTAQIKQTVQTSVRLILRRNAEEQNAAVSEFWEWSQLGIATLFFFLILFGERPPVSALALVPLMLLIVLLERFLLTPHILSLGREIDEIPARELLRNPIMAAYRGFHGVYSGCEILKILVGLTVGARLMIRRTPERTPQELERDMVAVREVAHHSSSDHGIRRRRRTDK